MSEFARETRGRYFSAHCESHMITHLNADCPVRHSPVLSSVSDASDASDASDRSECGKQGGGAAVVPAAGADHGGGQRLHSDRDPHRPVRLPAGHGECLCECLCEGV